MNALKQFGYMMVAVTPALYDNAFAAAGMNFEKNGGMVKSGLKGTEK
jgi:hypothetical protein